MSNSLKLENLALGGDAVGRKDGRAVFVPHGAPGDIVRIAEMQDLSGVLRGKLAGVNTPGPDRVEPRCPHVFRPHMDPAAVCGGCAWQHLAYPAQARAKKQLLIETFQRLARIAKPPVEDTVDAGDGAWRYRNKVQIPFALGPNGKITAGFYAAGTHKVVPFDDCFIQSEEQVKIVREAVANLRAHPMPIYDNKTGRGILRHLYLRTNAAGESLVALVVGDDRAPGLVPFAAHVMRACPSVKSVFLNVNPRQGNVVLGPEWRRIAGRPVLEEFLMGLKFRLSPGAFFQVNHAQAENLYGLAVAMAAPAPEDQVLELYAGVGAMGMLLAPRAARVWAVEENPHAVKDGIDAARLNGINNIRFFVGRCEDVTGRLRRLLDKAAPVVVLDPPRAGCSPSVLKTVMALSPKRIVYVSCDPGTLARDAKYLSTGGYHLKRAVPVDLFPQTAHVESVSLFTKS